MGNDWGTLKGLCYPTNTILHKDNLRLHGQVFWMWLLWLLSKCLNQIILAPGQSLHTSSNGSPHPVKKIQKNFKNNYASVECGAKILAANNEAKVTLAWSQGAFLMWI